MRDEPGQMLALPCKWRQCAVRSRGEVLERDVLVRELLQDSVRLPQRRVRAPDEGVQVLTAAGEARAELAQDDREALAVRQTHHVVDQVDVDGRAGVREGQEMLASP